MILERQLEKELKNNPHKEDTVAYHLYNAACYNRQTARYEKYSKWIVTRITIPAFLIGWICIILKACNL